jgi:hypothetical protein
MAALREAVTGLQAEKATLTATNAALQERVEALEQAEASLAPFPASPLSVSSEDRAWHAPLPGPYDAVVMPSTGRRLRPGVGQGLRKAAPVLAALILLALLAWVGAAFGSHALGRLASLASAGLDALLAMLERAEGQVMAVLARVSASPLIPVAFVLLAVVWWFGLRAILRALVFCALLLGCLSAGQPGLAMLLAVLALLWWYRRG